MAQKSGPAATGAAGKNASAEDINVAKLSQDKIKQLMRTDPRFITRLIGQLDKTMHRMMLDKQRKQEQIQADTDEINSIDNIINGHVQPSLDRLNTTIKLKTEQRDGLKKQLQDHTGRLKDMQSEAAGIIASARARTGKLMRATASQSLEEARGFSARVPTTSIIKTRIREDTQKANHLKS